MLFKLTSQSGYSVVFNTDHIVRIYHNVNDDCTIIKTTKDESGVMETVEEIYDTISRIYTIMAGGNGGCNGCDECDCEKEQEKD